VLEVERLTVDFLAKRSRSSQEGQICRGCVDAQTSGRTTGVLKRSWDKKRGKVESVEEG
jgi:hypothetical protein